MPSEVEDAPRWAYLSSVGHTGLSRASTETRTGNAPSFFARERIEGALAACALNPPPQSTQGQKRKGTNKMNSKLVFAFALACVMAIVGCVSVESTKMQLQSGNPKLISEAEENIYRIATSSDYSIKERIDYINLASNQDLLERIFAYTWYDKRVGVAVAKKMDFSKKNSIVAFIEKNKEIVNDCSRDEAVQKEIVNTMLSTATVEELVNAGKYLTSHYPCFYELRKPLAMKLANVATDQVVLFQLVDGTGINFAEDDAKDVALAKLTDQNKLMSLYCSCHCYNRDKVLEKLQDKTICAFIQNDRRYGEVSSWGDGRDKGWAVKELIARIKDEKLIAKILIAKNEDSGVEMLLDMVKKERIVAHIVVGAKNTNIRKMAAMKLKDHQEIVSLLMSGKVADKDLQLTLIRNIEDGTADVKLYDNVKCPDVQKAIFVKLSKEARVEVRSRSKAECEELIANAKHKGSETFELAGFYLGMNIGDAEKLIGYHFPEFLIEESKDNDGDKVLYVSNQRTPFCYADKNGNVYQINFGKAMLKKWYNYDVQTYMEWANAYGRETKIDMKFKVIEKDATVYEPMDMSRSYRVWFHQESFQYKHNTKGYRLTYFGEENEFTVEGGIGGDLIKEMASPRFRYVRGDPGLLRAAIENN